MNLRQLDSPKLIQTVAEWMSRKENYQWLDFGGGRQILTPEWLKIMTQRPTEVLRVFTTDETEVPIGVVGLTGVNRHFATATLWAVLGDKGYARQGYATRAVSQTLTLAFQRHGLHAVNTWIVEGNHSEHIVKRLRFRLIGRQRECHEIDGCLRDRLWFDLLASEHEEL